MKKLPKELYKYFWDVKGEDVDLIGHAQYVISRLMEKGDTQAVRWMREVYDEETIKQTLRKRKGIDRKSAWFWMDRLNMNLEEVKCLQRPYRRIPYGV